MALCYANHEYYIWRNRHGPLAKELQGKKGRIYPRRFVVENPTKLTPQEYRALTAEPIVQGTIEWVGAAFTGNY